MGFWGIDYFDVIRTWWYIFLAMIPAATLAARISAAKEPSRSWLARRVIPCAHANPQIWSCGGSRQKPRSRGDFSTEITRHPMKLSIVIICWNDWKVIENCLRSIFETTRRIQYEVIVSDNGSTDGSVEKIRAQFPAVRVVENRANLGFAKGNNAGIREAGGEYVLVLNPDTIFMMARSIAGLSLPIGIRRRALLDAACTIRMEPTSGRRARFLRFRATWCLRLVCDFSAI